MQTCRSGGYGGVRGESWGGGREGGLLLVIAGRIAQCFPCRDSDLLNQHSGGEKMCQSSQRRSTKFLL